RSVAGELERIGEEPVEDAQDEKRIRVDGDLRFRRVGPELDARGGGGRIGHRGAREGGRVTELGFRPDLPELQVRQVEQAVDQVEQAPARGLDLTDRLDLLLLQLTGDLLLQQVDVAQDRGQRRTELV